MERLSNIMRTTHLSRAAEQRLPQQHSPSHGQRQPLPVRRSLPEQGAGQSTAGRPLEAYRMRATPPPSRLPEARDEDWEESASTSARSTTRTPYNGSRAARTGQFSHYTEQLPAGDYYEEQEPRSAPGAGEYQDDWTDDTAGMRYGDWEDERGHYSAHDNQIGTTYVPSSSTRETLANQRPVSPAAYRMTKLQGKSSPMVTRELYRFSAENTQVGNTHDPRLAVSPGSQIVPAQPAPQRTTQPLRPQQLSRLPAEMQQRTPRQFPPVLPDTVREPNIDYTITLNSSCSICKGAGFLRSNVPFGHPQFGKAVPCQCKEQERKRKRRNQLMEISNLGAFANKRFDTFDRRIPGLSEAFQVSVNFAKAPNGWLFLIGPNGCGKTHLAAAVANQCLESGAVVLFATVPDLLDHLRAAFAPDSNEVYDQLFARMREAEVLVLDDLGTQQSSPWANEKLFQLLNYRYNSGFPTVITANSRGLQATDERIRSRLGDVSLVITLNLDRARDYRPHNPHRE